MTENIKLVGCPFSSSPEEAWIVMCHDCGRCIVVCQNIEPERDCAGDVLREYGWRERQLGEEVWLCPDCAPKPERPPSPDWDDELPENWFEDD